MIDTSLKESKTKKYLREPNMKSLLRLVDFYESNYDRLEEARHGLTVYGLPYPQMKLLDMGFWQIGFEKDTNKGFPGRKDPLRPSGRVRRSGGE